VIDRKQACKKRRKFSKKKEKIHVDKTESDKYNSLCACERNLLAAIK
jgi:hypothetical protein